jgi:hypothetical protein
MVHVTDLPWSDSNVGVEEMMHGLGFSMTEGKDPRYEPTPPTETEPFKSTNDAPHQQSAQFLVTFLDLFAF